MLARLAVYGIFSLCEGTTPCPTHYPDNTMTPFPSDPAEYEEYVSVMSAIADEINASTPDPLPSDLSPLISTI